MQETSDKNGETERYTYDALGRLIRKTYDGLTGVYGYTYNADGIRISVTNGTSVTYFEQDGSRIRYRKAGNELTQFLYDDRDSVLGMVWNGQTYFFKKNLQGDVVSLLHGDGTVAGTYTYDAWGKGKIASYDSLSDLTAMALNPFRYRGYYYDNETGFYYVSSRYYDPEVGRWINADSVIDQSSVMGGNLFVYCLNNPVNMTDETGNLPFFAITAAIGAVVGAIVGGVVAAKNGRNVWAGIGVGAAAGALIGTGVGMAAGAVLAGSITATTAQVAFGASALATTVATGGIGAGVIYVANNLQQAGNEISNVITTATQKIVSKTPVNPGKPFEAGKTGIQHGVNPNTLIPQKDLSTLNPQRMANAVKFGGDQAVRVGRTGIIQDGHHRVADAIMNGRAIDIFMEHYK